MGTAVPASTFPTTEHLATRHHAMGSSPTSGPEMSSATKNVLAKVQRMVPPMLEKFHKGQLGRVAVIGGSEDYTGAPYFSAMASARLGCDMSHLICTPGKTSSRMARRLLWM